MVVITSDQRDVIFDAVEAMYTDVAAHPDTEFHFPTGRRACEYVGYPAKRLDLLPADALASFAGVGYPFAADVLRGGDSVLDIGSGSGTDLLLSAILTGPSGQAIGVDMTEAMRAKCRTNARAAGLDHVDVVDGNAEELPVRDASVDVVTTNGVINLVPDKPAAIEQIRRVLKPGGWLQLSDIVVDDLPSEACRAKPQLWAECIVGATTETQYAAMLTRAGFRDIERVDRLDYFAASSNESTRETADGFGAHSVVLRARKA